MMPQRARLVLIAYATVISMLFGSLALEHFRQQGYAEAQPVSVAPADPLPSSAFVIDAGVTDGPLGSNGSATMSPTAVPLELATQSGETQWTLVKDYGPVWGTMLILFGIGAAFVKRNPEHWLAKGHALTAGVSAIGVLGALLEANFTSASGAGLPVTLIMAVKLLLQAPSSTSSAKG